MNSKNFSQDVQDALSYFSFDDIPTMKELNTSYRRLALKKHPDKNGGSDAAKEDYQNLQNFYKQIGNYIVENESNDKTDEERDHVATFKSFNFDQKNTYSHTIFIEIKLVKAWKQVLISKIGEPEDKGSSGLIFRLKDFKLNDEVFSITVTLYESPKDNQPKLHIQGSQYANNEFTLKELPSLYAEVRKIIPPEMISHSGAPEPSEVKKARGRPRQSAKSIKTVKDVVQNCKVQACNFMTKVTRDMNAHKKIHQREDVVDLRRKLSLEESVVVMEIATDEAEAPAPESPTDTKTSELTPDPAFNFSVQWKDFTEKNKLIDELKEKVTDLEKGSEILKKKFQKDEVQWEKDLTEMRKELNRAMDKASSLCEENTLLKEQVKTFQNREIANSEIQRKCEERLKVVLVTAGCQTEDQDEAVDIEVLSANRQTGYRRTDPASPPTAAHKADTVEQVQHNCNLCNFKSNSEARLNKHLSHKHHKCDICSRTLKTPALLRSHLREIHDKVDGTMTECKKCKFSALNESHLNLHIDRHHKELSCNQCEYKTEIRRNLVDHVAQNHRRSSNATCKYWLQNNCRRVNCQYKHEKVKCRFGRNCNRGDCQFGHDMARPATTNSTRPYVSPWTNPAFLGGPGAGESFPFLGQSQQCRCQTRRTGV